MKSVRPRLLTATDIITDRESVQVTAVSNAVLETEIFVVDI